MLRNGRIHRIALGKHLDKNIYYLECNLRCLDFMPGPKFVLVGKLRDPYFSSKETEI